MGKGDTQRTVFWFPQCQPEVVNNTIRHSLFCVLISSLPARGGQHHNSPLDETSRHSLFNDVHPRQTFWGTHNTIYHSLFVFWKMDETNVYSSRDKQHHSSFTIRFLGKWMRQGLGVDITIRHSLFLILQLGCPVHAPFIQ